MRSKSPARQPWGTQRSLPRAPGALTILSLCICGTNPCPMVCNLATSITANSIHKCAPSRHIKWVLLCLLLPRRVYMITVRAHHCMMKADTARDCPERHASSGQLHSECRLHAAGDARCAHVRIAHTVLRCTGEQQQDTQPLHPLNTSCRDMHPSHSRHGYMKPHGN